MKNIDINGISSAIFSGALVGISIGGYYGKTLEWTITGALLGIGAWVADYMRDQKKNKTGAKIKDQ